MSAASWPRKRASAGAADRSSGRIRQRLSARLVATRRLGQWERSSQRGYPAGAGVAKPGCPPLRMEKQKGGDWFRRGSVRRRRHLEVLSPRKTGGTVIAADNQLALAA